MAAKKYQIQLESNQRTELETLTHRGEAKARTLNRARILLLADENQLMGTKSDSQIKEVLSISMQTIQRTRRRFVEEGLRAALYERPRPGRPLPFSGDQRAHITALACSDPPEGYGKWSLRLLADRAVELDLVPSLSYNTVRNILKKNELKPHLKKQWCIGKLTPRFLWRMEDILHLYQLPYDPLRPLICFDERPCQLIDDVLMPLPMKEGMPQREDYHYQRNGVCNLFIAFEPVTGQRIVEITESRTKKDYARFLKKIADRYAQAQKICLIQDNLNTHTPASFYEAFEAEYAFDLTQRFEGHYTPEHASWLNMVEIELSVLSKQCLDRRIGEIETLKREVLAWVENRNAHRATVRWQFTPENAREKFSRFYPNLS